MGRIRYAGLAEEYSFNPVTPPDAIFHIDIGSATLDVPTDPNLHFEGGLYRGRKIIRPGFYAPTGNIVYPVDIRSIAYILKWALGSYVFTDGGEGANTHEIYGIEDLVLPSFCTRLGKDNFEHIFTGCVINSLEIKIEGEYVFITADIDKNSSNITTANTTFALIDFRVIFLEYNKTVTTPAINRLNNPPIE